MMDGLILPLICAFLGLLPFAVGAVVKWRWKRRPRYIDVRERTIDLD